MSLLDRLRKEAATPGKCVFGVIAGPRLGGKSTLAGTLKGRTLLLQVAVLESGSDSAKALASQRKNELYVANFSTLEELAKIITELKTDVDFDNVVVDGLSALTDLKMREPRMANLMRQDNWSAFRELADVVTSVLLSLKELTYPDKAKKPKHTFVTCALKIKQDKNGGVVDVELEAKGQVAVTQITKLGECVVTVLPPVKTETGVSGHRLITRSEDCWPGRIDGLLADKNPGVIEPADLQRVIDLRKGV